MPLILNGGKWVSFIIMSNFVLITSGHSGSDVPDIQYANWLSMVLAGLKGMEMFSPASGEWKQAHSQARFVITQVMLEAGQDFLTIKEVTGEDGKPDLLITMDRSKIMSVGQPAISQFLTKLQVMFLY